MKNRKYNRETICHVGVDVWSGVFYIVERSKIVKMRLDDVFRRTENGYGFGLKKMIMIGLTWKILVIGMLILSVWYPVQIVILEWVNSEVNALDSFQVAPNSGFTTGGTELTIMGEGFEEKVKIIEVASHDNHSLALDGDGNVYAWGRNDYGQIGNNQATLAIDNNGVACISATQCDLPVKISGLAGGALENGPKIIKIAAGINHSMALDEDGNVYTWGGAAYGQIGNNRKVDANDNNGVACIDTGICSLPVKISGLVGGALASSPKIVDIAGGVYFTIALDENGNVYTWGDNTYGQIGNNRDPSSANNNGVTCINNNRCFSPVKISGITGGALASSPSIVSITAGHYYAMAVGEDGSVYAWGRNDYGQLGNNQATLAVDNNGVVCVSNTQCDLPIKISGLSGGALASNPTIVTVGGGYYHSVAADEDGNVYAWGRNNWGQLGNNQATLAIDNNGVVCASFDRCNLPIKISGLSGGALENSPRIDAVLAGSEASLAMDSAGNVYAWGRNYYGQIGNDQKTSATQNNGVACVSVSLCYLPIKISGIDGGAFEDSPVIVGISTGGTHSMAVDIYGNVYTWGRNSYGQLGNSQATASEDNNGIACISAAQCNLPVKITGIAGSGLPATGFNIGLGIIVSLGLSGNMTNCSDVEIISDTVVECTTPPHSAGVVSVAVSNGIETVVLANGFIYVLPPYLSLSSSASTVNLSIVPTYGGSFSSGFVDFTVVTNNPTGYSMKISMIDSGRNLMNTSNTIPGSISGSSTAVNLIPTTGTMISPIPLANGTWGFAIPTDQIIYPAYLPPNGFDANYSIEINSSASTSVWAAVPAYSDPLTIKTSPISDELGDDTTIFFGARASLSNLAGVYNGAVLITVIGE